MGGKRKTKGKQGNTAEKEEHKPNRKMRKFCSTMRKGKAVAEINHHTLQEIAAAVKVLQRVAMLKSQDTANMVMDLERLAKKGRAPEGLTREAVGDKLKIANTLIAQGLHWDKVEGALIRLQCLCNNEDELLRGPWEYQSQELAPNLDEPNKANVAASIAKRRAGSES